MIHVLNAKERNQAFLKFLLFFLLTTTILVAAIYFDFGIPDTEVKLLRNEVQAHREGNQLQESFVAQMQQTKKLLDSINSQANPIQLDIQLTGKFTDLEKLRQRDTSAEGKLNSMIIEAFLELQQVKKESIKLREQALRASELAGQLAVCQGQLDIYRQQPPQQNINQ